MGCWNQDWNRNHMMLESESESLAIESELELESWILQNPGIGISPSGIVNGIGMTGTGIIYNSDIIQYNIIK